jgi:hypothetical protein
MDNIPTLEKYLNWKDGLLKLIIYSLEIIKGEAQCKLKPYFFY